MPKTGEGKIKAVCETCGKTIERYRSQFLKRIYCSKKCRVIPIQKRLDTKLDKSGGPESCWNFTGALHPDGYGLLPWGKEGRAHRISFILANPDFEITPGKVILHLCNNPKCCNPKHLKCDTQKTNVDQCIAEGRKTILSGVNNPNSLLTEEAVIDIRANYRRGNVKNLASKWGVTIACIRDCHRRRTYSAIP